MDFLAELLAEDPELGKILRAEVSRQRDTLVMIASENYASPAVLAASGSPLTNKYAEGYPGKRYYNGCENMDAIETLAIERAKALFGCDHVNVQPHAGAQANLSVYQALLKPGDGILSLQLDHGGHLSHGMKLNESGKLYAISQYTVGKESGRIDMDEVETLAVENKPKLIVYGASAYPRHFEQERFRAIADKVGAYLMADMAHVMGLIAGGAHPSPVPYCDVVTFTTHKTLRGPRGAMILCKEELAKAIDRAVFPGRQGGPFMMQIAGKAVMLKEDATPEFQAYAHAVVENAAMVAQTLVARGYKLVSGGTDNHLVLVDLCPQDIPGRDAANWLEAAGICCNKNVIPYDQRKPAETSGIRLGTAAITTRGLNAAECAQVADAICDVLDARGDAGATAKTAKLVAELCAKHPLYPGYLD